MREREEAERQWVEARMKWVAEHFEGGLWRCGECDHVIRLSKQEEADKVNVRCTGILGGLSSASGTNHWPTQMERIGDIVWELEDFEVERPERLEPMRTGPDWRTRLELNGEDE